MLSLLFPSVTSRDRETLGRQPPSHLPGGQGRLPSPPLNDLVGHSLSRNPPALGLVCHRHTLFHLV